MPPPQRGFFAYAADPFSLDTIRNDLDRRKPRTSASANVQQQQFHMSSSQQQQQRGSAHQLLPHQGGVPSSGMDGVVLDHHIVDRPVNAKIIRGSGGGARGLANGVGNGGMAPSTGSGRNASRQHEREPSPDNTANINNLKRKREVQDRVHKYARDRYEKRDECVKPFHVPLCGDAASSLL